MLTIYTNHPGGNSVHKHKTIEFDGVGRRTASNYNYPNQQSRLQRLEKLLHHKPQPIFSEASQERNGANHLTFQLEFPEISK